MMVAPANWDLFQRLLLLCVVPEPATLPYVLEQIISRANAGATPLRSELEAVLNTLIVNHSKLRHSSEVASAAWACLALRIQLHADAVDAISICDDSVVAILALDCDQHGLLAKPLNKTMWASHMTPASLYDEHWLLAYEANVQGWLPSLSGGDYVAADVNFGFLKAHGVHFYDSSLAAPPAPAPVPLPSLPTVATFGSAHSE